MTSWPDNVPGPVVCVLSSFILQGSLQFMTLTLKKKKVLCFITLCPRDDRFLNHFPVLATSDKIQIFAGKKSTHNDESI